MEREESQKKWLTTKDVAKYLSLSVSQVYNLVSNGTLVPHKLGRRNRFLIEEIDEKLMNRKGDVRWE
jgi:excisionase family DNA binding protein